MTLFCFPHAGTGASCYRDWLRSFPSSIDVRPVQLPGREGHFESGFSQDANELMAQYADLLQPEFDRPFALYGHSMGGMLAAELTAELLRRGRHVPRLLAVSGYSRGNRVLDGRASDDDDSLLAWLAGLGGTDELILANREMRGYVLSLLRSDLTMIEKHRPTWETLQVPILAMGGTADELIDPSSMYEWKHRSTVSTQVALFEGGHFFNHELRGPVSARIADELIAAGAR